MALLPLACAAALLVGCASSPTSPSALATAPTTAPVARSEDSALLGSNVAIYALSLLDGRYSYGGRNAPTDGLDCSGLVSLVYRQAVGIDLKGSSASMAQRTKAIPNDALQAGDLVFFNTLGPAYSHVGVYVGEGRFVHAANERSGVRVDRLSDRYYASRFEGARAVIE